MSEERDRALPAAAMLKPLSKFVESAWSVGGEGEPVT